MGSKTLIPNGYYWPKWWLIRRNKHAVIKPVLRRSNISVEVLEFYY